MANVWAAPEGDKPQVKAGWGQGGSTNTAANAVSNMGMAQKSAAANYWDNKTTEIFIPEMGEEMQEDVSVVVAEPPSVDHKMTNLRELNKDF